VTGFPRPAKLTARAPDLERQNRGTIRAMTVTSRIFIIRPLAFLAVVVAALTSAGCGINTIPTYEQQAKAAWSEVLNQYKRRTDLIPNLV
jgi:LemA protein